MAEISRLPDDPALWRYSIIAPLLHRQEHSPPLYTEIEAMAQRPYITPDGGEKYVAADTIRCWLGRYKSLGVEGLRNKQRKDRGRTSVPDSLQQALVSLRRQHPHLTVKRLLQQLMLSGQWDGRKPSRTAIYRFTTANHLNRSLQPPPQNVRPFEYPHFGDLWSADFLHGPKVKMGTYAKKSYLHAIIDDATRYVVAASFHLAENTESLLSDLMLAIRRFGIPKRFYTDNGAAYRSKHLRLVAAKLRIALPHTPPYTPQGRGKIERFFRSLRDGFLTGRPRGSREKLNADLSEWLSHYHQTPHRALGMSPLNRKLINQGNQLVQIEPTQNINDLFRMEMTKVVHTDGCVHLWGKRFEAFDCVPLQKVQVYYLPWDHTYVLIGPDKIYTKALDPIKNAHRFDKPMRGLKNNIHEKE